MRHTNKNIVQDSYPLCYCGGSSGNLARENPSIVSLVMLYHSGTEGTREYDG